ncbi:MAG: 3-isopropylmalate dehydratase small subunit [Candidatus Dormibacteraeota bacterium]|uniref:3-isopropylmalate dehydratase small subunit n=1 Tax=Candidatus Aeolococcus gillhamiae TaxID=3127015 RepID=A0A2W6ABE1_9BACT|nr:3-isopropylmalate dehydratase small subunit [Candidatus Dormibacteraeota bacterium]PZR80834.1 MAG: 3-isopropylmalate dehydratase small subunit [Candidatus Dormibacter sp. RRmetagenome_bin12]
MRPFRCEHGTLVPLDRSDVDTDQIIPKQFLKRIERSGFGPFLFHAWRYDDTGAERPDFVLNQDPYRNGTVLVAGNNFGCGSSREHAVWALEDHGIRAVISSSFADIFRGNALSCGLLPVILPEHDVRALLDLAAEDPGVECIVDLEDGTVTAGDLHFEFEIEPRERRKLLEGLDEVTVTLHNQDAISTYEAARPAWMPDLSRVEEPV